MTGQLADRNAFADLETPSGKGAEDENFPVGSILIRADLRRHVHALYCFARAADDIADNPDLASDDKIERLDQMEAILLGRVDHKSALRQSRNTVRMVESLTETGVTPQHCLDLLKAFRQDALKARYRDWDQLLGYCLLSASPIGRHLLDLHGESLSCRPASDALCNALQVVNHLQDCGKDYRALDRVYLPTDDMDTERAKIEDLGGNRLTPSLRRTLDRVIVPLDGLLAECRDIVIQVSDTRIALECEIIRKICVRLTDRLRHEDPIATRVALSKPASVGLALQALIGGIWRRHKPGLPA